MNEDFFWVLAMGVISQAFVMVGLLPILWLHSI